MRKVPESDYKNYVSWANATTANRVYPCSVAEGFQHGEIFVNDGASAESVFFWHYCGFGYISGKPAGPFLEDIYRLMTSGGGRRLLLITDDGDVTGFFRGKDVLMTPRVEYSYAGHGGVAALPDGFRAERIDESNISRIEGKIIPSFSWSSDGEFLKNGFGYIALEGDKVCSVAFSAAVSSDEIDIGVETREEYRGRSLASALSGMTCREILRLGKRPVWAHAAENSGSGKTALRCGFVEEKINTVIRVG